MEIAAIMTAPMAAHTERWASDNRYRVWCALLGMTNLNRRLFAVSPWRARSNNFLYDTEETLRQTGLVTFLDNFQRQTHISTLENKGMLFEGIQWYPLADESAFDYID